MATIHKIIYHFFNKEVHQDGIIKLNPEISESNDDHKEFLSLLTEKYAKQSGKGFGNFGVNTDIYTMPILLTDYLSDKDFYRLSQRMMDILKSMADREPLATGGKVFICHYEDDGTQFLLTTILTDQTTFSASTTDWQFAKTQSLDLDKLKYAGRINIDKWQAEEERYISFLKGKQANISEYFKHFLGCDDTVIAKTETIKLLELIDEFIGLQDMDFNTKQSFKENAQAYLQELVTSKTEFDTQSFANRLCPDEPQLLVDLLSHVDTGVSDGFIPDGRVIKKLSTYTAKTQHWQLSFDNQAISNGEIIHENGKIIIENPTDDLLRAFNLT